MYSSSTLTRRSHAHSILPPCPVHTKTTIGCVPMSSLSLCMNSTAKESVVETWTVTTCDGVFKSNNLTICSGIRYFSKVSTALRMYPRIHNNVPPPCLNRNASEKHKKFKPGSHNLLQKIDAKWSTKQRLQ